MRVNIPVTNSALNGRFKIISLPVPAEVGPDYQGVFADMEEHMLAVLEELLGNGVKFYVSLQLDMKQYINDDKLRHAFHSHPAELLQSSDIRDTLRSLSPNIVEQVIFNEHNLKSINKYIALTHFRDRLVCNYSTVPKSTYFKVDSYLKRGSGWIVERCYKVDLMVTEYNPISGGSYLELPVELKQKHSLMNIKNDDHKLVL